MVKKIPWLVVALIFALVAVFLVFFLPFMNESNREGEGLVETAKSIPNKIHRDRVAFVAQGHSPIHVEAKVVPNSASAESVGCVQVWSEITRWDVAGAGELSVQNSYTTFSLGNVEDLESFRNQLDYSARCQLSQTHPLRALSDELINKCESSDGSRSQPDVILGCMQAVLKLRFDAIDYLSLGVNIDSIQDESLLSALIYAQVMRPHERRDPDRLFDLSRRALELDPENVAAAEFFAQAAYLRYLKDPRSSNSSDLELAAQQLGRFFPDSFLTFETQAALARQQKDFVRLRHFAEDALQSGKKIEDVNYHLAWSSYLEGREDQAKAYLDEILRLDPDNEKANMSLRRIIESESLPVEVKFVVAPFFSDLGQFQYGVSMAPVQEKLDPGLSQDQDAD